MTNCHYASNGRVLCSSAFMSWKLRPLIRRFIVALSNVLSMNYENLSAGLMIEEGNGRTL